MSADRPRRHWILILGILLAVAVAVPSVFRSLLWRWELNPILRGRLVADELGCFNCHLPPGGSEIPNPGSRWGTVPRFGAGNAFMYASDRESIEEFIRYGAPLDWLDDDDVRHRLERQHLRMPAYDDLQDGELSDLVAFVVTIEGVDRPGGDAVAEGRELAKKHGCFACHGLEGSGGLPNPGSLGGFVPGFLGRNFDDLVEDPEEFREWVLDGTSSRLAANPVIRYFWDRQQISMPAYRDELEAEEVDAIWRWVLASRENTDP